jgi:hypothetical protein
MLFLEPVSFSVLLSVLYLSQTTICPNFLIKQIPKAKRLKWWSQKSDYHFLTSCTIFHHNRWLLLFIFSDSECLNDIWMWSQCTGYQLRDLLKRFRFNTTNIDITLTS